MSHIVYGSSGKYILKT